MSRTFATFFKMPTAADVGLDPMVLRAASMPDPIAIDVRYTARQLDAMLLACPGLEDDEELRETRSRLR